MGSHVVYMYDTGEI